MDGGWEEVDPEGLIDQLTKENYLGRGSYGTVFRVTWRGSAVAVKRLHESVTMEKDGLFRELNVMASFKSEFLVGFKAASTLTEPYLLIMEYVDGGNLSEFLSKYPDGIPMDITIPLAASILKGLAYLHAQNFIHRDLKPDNILLTTMDNILQAKITDFGCARVLSNSTRTAQRGTLGYMAPEVLEEVPHYDAKVDIFSFGILLYELLYGTKFLRSYAKVPGVYVIKGGKAKFSTQHQAIPDWMQELISSCWDMEPDNRPGASQVLEKIEREKQQEQEKEKEREREREKEQEKEREREKEQEREKEREREREKEKEREREKEWERERERKKEQERKREQERQKEWEREQTRRQELQRASELQRLRWETQKPRIVVNPTYPDYLEHDVQEMRKKIYAGYNADKDWCMINVMTLGGPAIGSKTSFISRFVDDTFTLNTHVTVGVDGRTITLAKDLFDPPLKANVHFFIWDTAGQYIRFRSPIGPYMRNIDVAIFGYSVADAKSWDEMQLWESEMAKVHTGDSPYLKILVGGKCDLEKTWDQSFIKDYCRENRYLNNWEVSAKDNINVSEVFHYIAALLLQPRPEDKNEDENEESKKGKNELMRIHPENKFDKDARCYIA